jgi:hypothetical protein
MPKKTHTPIENHISQTHANALQRITGGFELLPPNPSQAPDLLSAINPIAAVSGLIGDIAFHKQQIKQLEVAQRRIEEEAGIRHHQIEAELQKALQELAGREATLNRTYKLAKQELKSQRKSRETVDSDISKLIAAITDGTRSVEDRQLLQAVLVLMMNRQSEIGEQSANTLSQMTRETHKALETQSHAQWLLTN